MTRVRTASRKDANHDEIKDCLSKLGWSVLDIFQIPNSADLIVAKNGFTALIECKDGAKSPSRRKLTDGERTFAESWRGYYCIIEGVSDALTFDREVSHFGYPLESVFEDGPIIKKNPA